jgi:hypothetical protein
VPWGGRRTCLTATWGPLATVQTLETVKFVWSVDICGCLVCCLVHRLACGLHCLNCRLTAAEASLSSMSACTAVTRSTVQPEQLSAAVSQLSTAAQRQQQQLTVQVAGLAGRLEALEDDAARRGQVISQVCGGCAAVRSRCQWQPGRSFIDQPAHHCPQVTFLPYALCVA